MKQYFCNEMERIQAIVAKRNATREARKSDTGCDCHGLPRLECPNHRPEARDLFARRVSFRRSSRVR